MSEGRDTVWRRADGKRYRMSVTPGEGDAPSRMLLSPFGVEHGDMLEPLVFTLVGSVPVEVSV